MKSTACLIFTMFAFSLQLIEVEANAKIRFRLPISGLGRGSSLPPGTKVLTRAELRKCVSLEAESNSMAAGLDSLQSKIRVKSAEINKLDARLTLLEGSLDQVDQNAVINFNRLVSKHRRLIAEYNGSIPLFNSKAEAHNKLSNRFNATCAKRAYYADDMAAIRSGR